MSARLLVGLGCALSAACIGADPAIPSIGEKDSAIYHGVRARGYEATVRVRLSAGVFDVGSCSGTVVAPRVVITARHCIDDIAVPNDVVVETGAEGELGQFGVAEIRTTTGDLLMDNDFAVLIMRDRVEAPSVPWAATFDPAVGDAITLVGYGLTDEAVMQIGIKHVGEASVDEWTDLYFITAGDQNSCFGDSGGTALDATGTLVGVITHGLGGSAADPCEGARSGMNRVDPYADMITQAISDTFVCEAAEICGDAVDDDCDGRLDDGCARLGDECMDAVQCASGDCRAFDGPSVCTQACTPGAFPDECPQPLECQAVPGGSGACLREPLQQPDELDASVDAGADAGPGETAKYGCGCRSAGARGSRASAAVLGLLALVVCARRRR